MILGVSKNSAEMAEMFDIAQRLANQSGLNTDMGSYPDGYGPNSQDVMIPAFLAGMLFTKTFWS